MASDTRPCEVYTLRNGHLETLFMYIIRCHCCSLDSLGLYKMCHHRKSWSRANTQDLYSGGLSSNLSENFVVNAGIVPGLGHGSFQILFKLSLICHTIVLILKVSLNNQQKTSSTNRRRADSQIVISETWKGFQS